MKMQKFLIELSSLLKKYGYYELEMKFFDGEEIWNLYQNSENKLVADNDIDVFVEPHTTDDLLTDNDENSYHEFVDYEEFLVGNEEDDDFIY